MPGELDAVKALLDAHLSNLRGELSRLASNYDNISKDMQSLANNTNVAIAEIRKDLISISSWLKSTSEELSAVKRRIEINEDVQSTRWTEFDTIKKIQEKKSNFIIALLSGAILTTIGLIITSFYRVVFP